MGLKALLTTLTLTLAFCAGCSDFNRFYKEKRQTPGIGKDTVAVVNSERITKEELIRSLEALPVKQRIIYLSGPERLREYLDSYINQILLYKEAKRKGIDKREDIKQRVERYKRRLLIQALGEEILNRGVSEKEVERYYRENQRRFEQVRISSIFIKVAPEQGVDREEARKRAKLLTERARRGEDFKRLAKEFSDDNILRDKGGDMGYFLRGQLPGEIDEVAFSLKQGEVSNPIETKKGFYVVKVTEGPSVLPLERVRGRIRFELRNALFSEYTKELREKAGVEVFEDRLKEITKR
ncbi:Foldase protein PrsA 3 [bacterium HR37]|nr:Foldase protein PrsA 3 [bacterium HR37]